MDHLNKIRARFDQNGTCLSSGDYLLDALFMLKVIDVLAALLTPDQVTQAIASVEE